MNCKNTKPADAESQAVRDSQTYPGVAVNEADDQRDNKDLIKERTHTLNNNPRNNDL